MSVTLGTLGGSAKPSLPSVALLTFAGESTTLAAVAQGQPMVVNLWVSWCPPCQRELPVLAAIQQQEKGMTFVFVNQGEDAGTALHSLSTHQLDLRQRLFDTHLGELSKASLASKLAKLRTARPISIQCS
jgi:thiol-disulfide isomerase/thioredoxin